MAWRKWLVRSLVFSVLGLIALAALLYEAWTNPAAVRRQVLAKAGQQFIGASVSLESARLRLLGGIAVRDVHMTRRDDLDRGDFLYVPSASIYHDKEHLLDGTLAVRKIELDQPHLRIVRERDGKINLAGVLSPPNLDERVPTIIIRRGTILFEDRSVSSGGALLEIKDVDLTVVNDPLSTLVIEGAGRSDVLGAVRIHARFHRPSDAASAAVELPAAPVGTALMQRIAAFCPDLAKHIRRLSGVADLRATLTLRPDAVQPLNYDVRLQFHKGEWHHESLPVPLRHMEASLRCVNGRVPYAKVEARGGDAKVVLQLWDAVWPARPPTRIEELVRKLRVDVEHFAVTPQFFERLPAVCRNLNDLYKPAGPVTLRYDFQRGDAKKDWRKIWQIHPEGMTAEFKHFRYPLQDVKGSVQLEMSNSDEDFIVVDLTARGSQRLVTVKGTVRGDKAEEVDLVVAADDVPVNQALLAALPEKSRETTRTFLPADSRELGLTEHPLGQTHPAGLANIKVYIRRQRGHQDFSNRYLIFLHDSRLRYDLFPYPLENVSGVLDIQPDHWECRDFRGTHKGGEIRVKARSRRVANGEWRVASEEKEAASSPATRHSPLATSSVQVAISGRDILLDSEFERALSPPKVPGRAALRHAWSMLALKGRLSFEAVVEDQPDKPQDLDVSVDVNGCSMQPEFFRYAMTDVSARVRYAGGRVFVKDVRAKHDNCELGLKEAVIALKQPAGFQGWFKGIRGTRLIPDEEFLRALHPLMRRGLEPLRIHKPLDVETALVLDAPATPGQPMKIWWDGGARLHDQLFQTGVEISGVDGTIWCHGHHNGQQFEGVSGYAVLPRATILGQPFTNLQGRIEISPETPDILRLYDLKANIFGGFAGGEARFVFGPNLHYEVKLDALHVQLEQFGKHNKIDADAQLQGPVRASLYLTGDGTDLSGLKGNGRIEVANGKLYRLPMLLQLLKAFGLRMPDRTAFEQARMIFAIEGPTMRVHALDLYGNAISLRGQGTARLDGSNLNLDFNADWGRLPQLLPGPASNLLQALSNQLFKIKVRGKITAPHFVKEPVPSVVDPIKKVFRGSS